jgi:hypothetical protein
MSADISNLSNLQAGEPLDHDIYVDSKEIPPPPAKGEYVVRAAEQITFGATQAGFLQAQIDPTIVGPTSAGYQLRFTKVSAKPFKRGKATVSQLGDFLRAVYGANGPRPTTPQEQADAASSCAGATFRIFGDWEAYDKETKWTLKGMENFPLLPNGERDPWVEVPNSAVDGGEPRKVRANFKVDRYIAAV